MERKFSSHEADDPIDELRRVAFEYLLLHPGSGFGDWRDNLPDYCPAEVVDALGADPDKISSGLADLWITDYKDPATGIEQKFGEWALTFANDHAVGLYYFLTDACKDLRRMGRKI